MASEPTLDLDLLAAPISEEQPAGSYLKDTDYDRLQKTKDQRARAVTAERKGRELLLYSEEDLEMIPEQDRQVETPDWRSVRDSCTEILAEHSKDLWVSAWLVEANTRLAGFAGMRDAFRLIEQLIQKYWSDISPPPDEEEGYLGTVSQLTSLNGEDGPGTLIVAIEEAPLLPVGEGEFSFAAYRQATEGSGAALTEGEFLTAARNCELDRLRAHAEDIGQAIEAFASMNGVLDEHCGEFAGTSVAPPSTQVKKALEECQRAFGLITQDVLGVLDSTDDGQAGEMAPGGVAAVAQTQVTNREDAFRILLMASEFFRKTEPHSPVSYMLKQAVRFGRMELPELLKEVIDDDNRDVFTSIAERWGFEIKPDDETE